MFEDNELATPQEEKAAISWEELTGLSGNMLREIRQTHELARKMIPRLPPGITDMVKPPLLAMGDIKSSLAMDAIRSSLATDIVKPPLLAMDVIKSSLATDIVKPSLAMDMMFKPSLLAMDSVKSWFARDMVEPGLRVNALKPSLTMDMVKPSFLAMDAMRSWLATDVVETSSAMVNVMNTLTNVGSLVNPLAGVNNLLMVRDSVIRMSDAVSSLSGSLIGIGQALDWIGGATSLIGNIQAWMPYNFKHLEEKLRLRILAAFERAGLCLAPSMSEDLMHQIAYYEERGDLRPVTLLVWRYYAEHDYSRLRMAVSGWRNNPEFAARWHFFDAALRTHIMKIYESSVSILFPHIEGIASTFVYDNVQRRGLNNGGPKLGKTEAVILYMLNIAGDVPNLDASVSGFKGWIMVKSILQYVQNALCRFIQFGQDFGNVRRSRELHRHAALHGIQLAHTTAMNSLRLFLLLDSIHYILESYKNNGKVIW